MKRTLSTLAVGLFSITAMGQGASTPTPQWRPQYHFSPPKNWTNDPNGLIFLDGRYNLYYQHNPFGNKWGHMSWGHAVSTDLVHWKDLPVAIPQVVAPDTTTDIFSGCAVLDKDNTSGFGAGALVAVFTADQPKQHKESQFIAYSTDGGLRYTMYPGNPVIDLHMHDFRDPNVFWCDKAGRWVMTVAMVNEHQVRFYGSPDLKTWTRLSDFGPAGAAVNGWECPSMLPLKTGDGKTKWVVFVSCGGGHGPMMQYFVGDFDGTTFTPDDPTPPLLTVDQGDAFYAAISWRDAPGHRMIMEGWLQNGKPETYPWKGQMSIPRDLTLRATPAGLRLMQNPTAVIADSLDKISRGRRYDYHGALKTPIFLDQKAHLTGNAYWLDVTLDLTKATTAYIDLAYARFMSPGARPVYIDGDKKVRVGYDVARREMFVDCTASEKDNKPLGNQVLRAPLESHNGKVRLRVLFDRSSLEVFGGDGEQVISTMVYPDADATALSLSAEGHAIVDKLRLWNLER
ncbi:MAG TPA: glycoside hydrolase family 32 protein [Dinghuibacter sp.]|uniref:glycoside hydrolase family 32 protein n=1 Tax=Dinghuibacter sp. TaxID=2024697 RepID=UPI002B6A1810|nr:glycoside hydrolase family 32 protein [Dinghuibacter sp.]HTJ12300.1 glycoside hydrolase family 32 protein [Dinghuibacter sp.]